MTAPGTRPPQNVLVVVATDPEAKRLRDLPVRVVVSGVGAVAAALATWRTLSSQPPQQPFELVVSAGIAGAYPASGLVPGDLAVSSQIIQADLGAEDGPQFLNLAALGLSVLPTREQFGSFGVWEHSGALAQHLNAAFGPMLTLNTVTGTGERAAQLEQRFPGALTEGMEGAGVAHAALLAGIPALEIRGISNLVGPRDRSSWRLPEALSATYRGVAEVSGFRRTLSF